jgi:hypothetical protein
VDRSYEPRPNQVASYDRWFSLYEHVRETMDDVWVMRRSLFDG